MTTEEIVLRMLASVSSLAAVRRPLSECLDCILVSPVCASADIPERPVANRDGYAVRVADVAMASGLSPVRLHVIGESGPGEHLPGLLPEGCAVRVMTGAPLPVGADAVVQREDCRLEDRLEDAAGARGHVQVLRPAPVGQFVAGAGSEFKIGQAAVPAGAALGPAELAVLAALGMTDALIIPKPRVSIVVTGNELGRRGSDAPSANLYASNAVLVAAMIAACGATVESSRIASDVPAELADALRGAMAADLILTTGGTGQGTKDLMSTILHEQEVASLWDLKGQSGRPTTFRLLRQTTGDRLVPHLALPGRPVAAMVAFSLFAYPLLRQLMGLPLRQARYQWARLTAFPESDRKAQRHLPVRLRAHGEDWEAVPTGDSSLYGLAAAVGAHGFALIEQSQVDAAGTRRVRVLIPPWARHEISDVLDLPAI